MSNGEESKLWNNYDKSGRRLFTQIPNALMCAIVRGDFGKVEMQIIFYICRMLYGFRREETCYLGPDDFKEATGIAKPHFSKQMNALLRKGDVFRAQKNGDKYKYAINLLRYGCTMKYYKYVDAGYKLCSGDCISDGKSYKLGNCEELKNGVIVYNSRGYDNKEELYKKVDKNTDTKKDSASVSSSLGRATRVEATKATILPVPKPATTEAKITLVKPTRPSEEVFYAFEKEIKDAKFISNVPIMVKYMELFEKEGFDVLSIPSRFRTLAYKYFANPKDEEFRIKECGMAISTYNGNKYERNKKLRDSKAGIR